MISTFMAHGIRDGVEKWRKNAYFLLIHISEMTEDSLYRSNARVMGGRIWAFGGCYEF